MILTDEQQQYVVGYATALSDMMTKLCGSNMSSTSYDPCTFADNMLLSYAFDLKTRDYKHDLADFNSIEEITDLMLEESVRYIDDVNALK